jgi:(4S)-4-hydroxy-5-phosphonooxypentane-2,3-dione isomerase
MMIRLVKMTVPPGRAEEFERLYATVRERVLSAPGCRKLELYRDLRDSGIFFTWSLWDDEPALEAYRKSEIYRSVWPKLKAFFSSKAEAWSTTLKNPES